MEILQIRTNNQTARTYMADITRVELECGHIDHKISFFWGTSNMIESVCGVNFAEMQQLYNELLSALVDHSLTSAFIIDIESNGKEAYVKSWKYLTTYTIQDLRLPTEKKYSVRLNYKTHVDVDVTASDEKDAYMKAVEVRDNVSYKDDNIAMQLTENMIESGHEITDVQ